MITYCYPISRNYSVDFTLFHKVRSIKDGITFLKLTADVDWYKADHNPKVHLHLIIFNCTIIEIDLYNVHHIKE